MNKSKQININPDLTFEDKYYLENPLDSKAIIKRKNKLKTTYKIWESNSFENAGDKLVEHILKIKSEHTRNILNITLSFSHIIDLTISSDKYLSYIDPVTSKELLKKGLYMSIFGILIYTNKKIGDDEMIIEWE